MHAIARQLGRGKHQRDVPGEEKPTRFSLDLDRRAESQPITDSDGFMKPVRRDSKLTVGGLVYIGVSVFLAIGAINSQNNLLFWLFGVAIATLVVSGLFSGNALMQIRLKAQSVADIAAGESVKFNYTVKNQSKMFPLIAAMISELPSDQYPNDVYPKGDFRPAALLHIGTRQTVRVHGSIVPEQRGRYSVRMIRLSSRFPFGLLHKSLVFECHRQMMVMPYQLAIKPGLVRIEQGRGDEVRKRTDSSGASNEYWGMREYLHGDPMRSIAWKQSARYGSLVVVEHAVPISSKLWIWIPEFNQKGDLLIKLWRCERAVALALSLIQQGVRQGVPVGLWIPAHGIQIRPGNGRRHIERCLRALCLIDVSRSAGRDFSPPAALSDDVLKLDMGTQAHEGSSRTRCIRVERQDDWLIDAQSLPSALKAEELGGKR